MRRPPDRNAALGCVATPAASTAGVNQDRGPQAPIIADHRALTVRFSISMGSSGGQLRACAHPARTNEVIQSPFAKHGRGVEILGTRDLNARYRRLATVRYRERRLSGVGRFSNRTTGFALGCQRTITLSKSTLGRCLKTLLEMQPSP
jgi:hypothetical protein